MKTLLSASLLLLSSAAPLVAQDPVVTDAAAPTVPAARTVVDHFLESTGRAARLPEIQRTRIEGKMEIEGMNLEGKYTMYQARPNKMLLVAEMAGIGEIRQGYDGKVGWGMQGMLGSMLLEGASLVQARDQAEFDSQLYRADDIETLENMGTTTFEGQPCYELRVITKHDPSLAVEMTPEQTKKYRESLHYFAVDTGLMVGQKGIQASPNGDVNVVVVHSDYKDFEGVQFPTKVTQKAAGVTVVMTTTAIHYDDYEDAVFALPKEIQALLPKKDGELVPAGGGDGR